MFQKNIIVLKFVFVFLLFWTFLIFFGIPNVKKYIKNDSLVVQSVKESSVDPILAPSIVICSTNPATGIGWKIGNGKIENASMADVLRFYRFVCGSADDLQNCISDKTYGLDEAVLRLSFAGGQFEELRSPGHFRSDIRLTGFGQCHTLKKNATILPTGRSYQEGFLTLTLNSSLDHLLRGLFS